jgi:hypothetical protein
MQPEKTKRCSSFRAETSGSPSLMQRDGPSPLVNQDEPHEDQYSTQPAEAYPCLHLLRLAARVRVEPLRGPDPSLFGVTDHTIALLLPRLYGRVVEA